MNHGWKVVEEGNSKGARRHKAVVLDALCNPIKARCQHVQTFSWIMTEICKRLKVDRRSCFKVDEKIVQKLILRDASRGMLGNIPLSIFHAISVFMMNDL